MLLVEVIGESRDHYSISALLFFSQLLTIQAKRGRSRLPHINLEIQLGKDCFLLAPEVPSASQLAFVNAEPNLLGSLLQLTSILQQEKVAYPNSVLQTSHLCFAMLTKACQKSKHFRAFVKCVLQFGFSATALPRKAELRHRFQTR